MSTAALNQQYSALSNSDVSSEKSHSQGPQQNEVPASIPAVNDQIPQSSSVLPEIALKREHAPLIIENEFANELAAAASKQNSDLLTKSDNSNLKNMDIQKLRAINSSDLLYIAQKQNNTVFPQKTQQLYEWMDNRGKDIKQKTQSAADVVLQSMAHEKTVNGTINFTDQYIKKQEELNKRAKELEHNFINELKTENFEYLWKNKEGTKVVIWYRSNQDTIFLQEYDLRDTWPKKGRSKIIEWIKLKPESPPIAEAAVEEKAVSEEQKNDQEKENDQEQKIEKEPERDDFRDFYIYEILISQDEKFIAFRSYYKMGVLILKNLDELFDEKYDIAAEMKKSFSLLIETKKQDNNFSQFYISSENHEIGIKWNGPFSAYKYYQTKLGGQALYDRLCKQGEPLISIDDDTMFMRVYYDEKKKEENNYTYIIGGELIVFETGENIKIYDPHLRSIVPFYDYSKNEEKKVSQGSYYYGESNRLYIKNEETIKRYYRTEHNEKHYFADEQYSFKVDPKSIRNGAELLKVVNHNLFYFSQDRFIKIWNQSTEKLEAQIRIDGYLNPLWQIKSTDLLIASSGFYSYYYSNPFLEYKSGYSNEVQHVQEGFSIQQSSILQHEQDLNKDFQFEEKFIEEHSLVDYIPSQRIVIWQSKNLNHTVIMDLKNKCKQYEFKELLGQFVSCNKLKKIPKNKNFNKMFKTYASVIFCYNKETQQQGQFKAIIIPYKNLDDIKIITLHTFDNIDELQTFHCKSENNIVFSSQKGNEERKTYISKVVPDNEVGVKLIDFKELIVKEKIDIKLLSKNRLYFNDISTGKFNVAFLDEKLGIVSKIQTFPKIKDVIDCWAIQNRILIQQERSSFFITNSRGDMIKSHFRNLFYGIFMNDQSNPDQLFIRDYNNDRLALIHLFDDHRLSLPSKFFIKEEGFTRYDNNTKTLYYFQSIDKDESYQALSKFQVRTHINSYLDFLKNEEGELLHTFLEVIDYINETPINELLSYNILMRKSFLFEAITQKLEIVNALLKKMELFPPNELPFLFPRSGMFAMSSATFEVAIEKHMTGVVKRLLDLMVESDPQGLIYQSILDRNIEGLLELGVDINNYLRSSMPMHMIETSNEYPQFHEDDFTMRLPAHYESIKESEQKMSEVITKRLLLRTNSWYNLFISSLLCKSCRKTPQNVPKSDDGILIEVKEKSLEALKDNQVIPSALSQVQPIIAKTGSQLEMNQEEGKEKSPLVIQKAAGQLHIQGESDIERKKRLKEENSLKTEMQYYIVNLKKILTNEKQLFMQLILDESNFDINVLNIPIIQEVIEFKWETYTRKFFFWQFIKIIVFFGSFIADIICMSSEVGLKRESKDYLASSIETRIICMIYMLDFMYYEGRQLYHQGVEEYFINDIWNLFDLMFVLLYIAYVPISFIYAGSDDDYVIKVIQCLIIFLMLIKFNFYLRIFEGFSFLVQMIQAVFYDLRFFILYFCIIISAFSIQVSIIMQNVEGHEGIGPVQFFVMTLRTSLGDNDINEENSEYKILFWIIWLLIMFVGNIVLMNFIIAVVGESYENCMTTRDAQCFKVKVLMIVEREMIMGADQLANTEWFPNYILVRRPLDSGNDKEQNDPNAKVVKEINKEINIMKTDLAQKIKLQEEATHSMIQDVKKELSNFKQDLNTFKQESKDNHKQIHEFLQKAFPLIVEKPIEKPIEEKKE